MKFPYRRLPHSLATKAATECSSGDVRLLSQQMSNSVEGDPPTELGNAEGASICGCSQNRQKPGERRQTIIEGQDAPTRRKTMEDWFDERKHPLIGDCKDFLNNTTVTVGRSPGQSD